MNLGAGGFPLPQSAFGLSRLKVATGEPGRTDLALLRVAGGAVHTGIRLFLVVHHRVRRRCAIEAGDRVCGRTLAHIAGPCARRIGASDALAAVTAITIVFT